MKKYLLVSSLLALSLVGGAAQAGCEFNWRHYGGAEVYKRIGEQIGRVVTEEYCRNYNRNYEIYIITNTYTNSDATMGHAIVGLRRRGSEAISDKRFASYRHNPGNFVIAKGYELAASAAIENLKNIMSSLSEYAPR